MSEEEKYEQLRQVCLSYRNEVADLEAKLAESEKNVEFYKERYSDATTSAYGADLMAKDYQWHLEKEIAELKQQLAEKEKENELMAKTLKMTKFVEKEVDQDKITFAIEKLKECLYKIQSPIGEKPTLMDDGDVFEVINNQIKQLKEMK